jgi:hypothetical protein
VTLREELGVRTDPEFDLALPKGWARHGLDDATLTTLITQVKHRCMESHRLQLFAELKAQLETSFADMRRAGVIAYFSPTDPGPDTLAIPASINALIRHAEAGATLDDEVRSLIRDHDAQPLLGDKTTLRFETERTTRLGMETIVSHSVVYMTPVPGSHRRRALVLVAGFGRPIDVPTDSDSMNAMRLLFDAVASSLTWRAPKSTRN